MVIEARLTKVDSSEFRIPSTFRDGGGAEHREGSVPADGAACERRGLGKHGAQPERLAPPSRSRQPEQLEFVVGRPGAAPRGNLRVKQNGELAPALRPVTSVRPLQGDRDLQRTGRENGVQVARELQLLDRAARRREARRKRSNARVIRRRQDHDEALGREAGMATAEYAIATLAAVGFAALLVAVLSSGEIKGLLMSLITSALNFG